MRAGMIIPKVVVLLAALAVPRVGYTQAAGPAVNISAVVRGGVVIVSYDLVGNSPTAEFSVVLEASSDGGKTYNVRPRALKGDVGPAVRAGIGKQITWQAAQDVENLDVDRYRYRVVAEPVRAQVPTTRAPEPARLPAVVQTNHGNGRRWGGIAMMSGGGTLALLAMTTMRTEEHDEFGVSKNPNKMFLWAGLGAAAGGVALFAAGGPNDSVGTQILIAPGGVMVQHRRRFKDIARAIKR